MPVDFDRIAGFYSSGEKIFFMRMSKLCQNFYKIFKIITSSFISGRGAGVIFKFSSSHRNHIQKSSTTKSLIRKNLITLIEFHKNSDNHKKNEVFSKVSRIIISNSLDH